MEIVMDYSSGNMYDDNMLISTLVFRLSSAWTNDAFPLLFLAFSLTSDIGAYLYNAIFKSMSI